MEVLSFFLRIGNIQQDHCNERPGALPKPQWRADKTNSTAWKGVLHFAQYMISNVIIMISRLHELILILSPGSDSTVMSTNKQKKSSQKFLNWKKKLLPKKFEITEMMPDLPWSNIAGIACIVSMWVTFRSRLRLQVWFMRTHQMGRAGNFPWYLEGAAWRSHPAPGDWESHPAGLHSVTNTLFQKLFKSELRPSVTAVSIL